MFLILIIIIKANGLAAGGCFSTLFKGQIKDRRSSREEGGSAEQPKRLSAAPAPSPAKKGKTTVIGLTDAVAVGSTPTTHPGRRRRKGGRVYGERDS